MQDKYLEMRKALMQDHQKNPQIYYDEKTNKLLIVGSAAAVGLSSILIAQEQAQAAPDAGVQAVVGSITDTLPILSTITMLVFSAGLAPWAAKTTLGWLSSIMRGQV
jgi:uncharacterized membrane protein